jgi:hypothetical protein
VGKIRWPEVVACRLRKVRDHLMAARWHLHWRSRSTWRGTYRLDDCRCGARRVTWHYDGGEVRDRSGWIDPAGTYEWADGAAERP